jgi:hypothetical protein
LRNSEINTRLKKMEERLEKKTRNPRHVPTYWIWRDGTPKTEEDARIKAKTPWDGKGVRAIVCRDPGLPGHETTPEEYRRFCEEEANKNSSNAKER